MGQESELEDLEELVALKGWHLVKEHFERQMNDSFLDVISQVMKKGGTEQHIRQLVAARDQQNTIFAYPKERIAILRRRDMEEAKPQSQSRRGGVL